MHLGNKKQNTADKADDTVEEGWDIKKSPKDEKGKRDSLTFAIPS